MTETDLLFTPAVKAAALIRAKKLSPVEYVDAVLKATDKANPRLNVEVGAQTFTVLAEELDDTARAELWPKLVAEAPTVGEHQTRTTRQIPVLMLTRQD